MIAVPSASTGRRGDNIARLRLFAALASAASHQDDEGLGEGRGGDARSADRLRDHPSGSANLYRATGLRGSSGRGRPDREKGWRIPSRGRCTRILPAIGTLWRWSSISSRPSLRRSKPRSITSPAAAAHNWRAFLDATVGDDEGFLRFPLREESAPPCERARIPTRSKPRSRRCWRLARRSRPAGAIRAALGREHDRKLSSAR